MLFLLALRGNKHYFYNMNYFFSKNLDKNFIQKFEELGEISNANSSCLLKSLPTNIIDIQDSSEFDKNDSIVLFDNFNSLSSQTFEHFDQIWHYSYAFNLDLDLKSNSFGNFEKKFQFCINTSWDDADTAKDLITDFICTKTDCNQNKLFEIGLVFRELITNSIKHGNEQEFDKKIFVSVFINKESEVLLILKDESSFNLKNQLKSVEDVDDLRTSNRGLFLIKHFSDEIIEDNFEKIVKFIV